MTSRTKNGLQRCAVLAVLVAVAAPGGASAHEYGNGGSGGHPGSAIARDGFRGNRGSAVHDAPPSGHAIHHGHHRYRYDPVDGYRRGVVGTSQPGPAGQLHVNHRNGVSSVQQVKDRYACDTYAVEQSGFDPTKIGGGVSPDAAPTRKAIY